MYMIQTIVLSGGANVGFIYLGILKSLFEKNILNWNDLNTIYATSVGTLIAVSICLQKNLDEVECYYVERPWNELYKCDLSRILWCFQNGGIFDKYVLMKTLEPLLKSNDLSLEITLKEFYEFSKIDMHFFVTKFSDFSLCDISHHTHPSWTVIDAVYSSCSLPIMFKPEFIHGEYYIDGGVITNYPLDCAIQCGCNIDTTLGINHRQQQQFIHQPYTETSNYKLLDFIVSFINNIWLKTRNESNACIKHQIVVECRTLPQDIMGCISSQEEREKLVNLGKSEGISWADTYTE